MFLYFLELMGLVD
jgi:hypothetical protein